LDNFQGVRKRSLELVPELGPSFEEDKVEKFQYGNGRNLELEGKEEQQANPDSMENMKT
jgi:hypothetical protein